MLRITVLTVLTAAQFAVAEELVTLPTRDGVTQSFLLAVPEAAKPAAAAVLFPGGPGNIRLRRENGEIKFGAGNFLVRSRKMFVDGGVAVAVVDTPSDQPQGMDDRFRLGDKQAETVAEIVNWMLKKPHRENID